MACVMVDNSQADIVAHRQGVEAVNRRKRQKVSISHSTDASGSVRTEVREPDEFPPEPRRVQQQLLDDESQALQVELSNLLDPVRETETKMVEMSALNHLMSTHVLQQAPQFEFLYEQALEATNNVDMGNKELTQAIDGNSSSRTFLLLFFFVLTISVLFLDQSTAEMRERNLFSSALIVSSLSICSPFLCLLDFPCSGTWVMPKMKPEMIK